MDTWVIHEIQSGTSPPQRKSGEGQEWKIQHRALGSYSLVLTKQRDTCSNAKSVNQSLLMSIPDDLAMNILYNILMICPLAGFKNPFYNLCMHLSISGTWRDGHHFRSPKHLFALAAVPQCHLCLSSRSYRSHSASFWCPGWQLRLEKVLWTLPMILPMTFRKQVDKCLGGRNQDLSTKIS